jgi:hypothetical protein
MLGRTNPNPAVAISDARDSTQAQNGLSGPPVDLCLIGLLIYRPQ